MSPSTPYMYCKILIISALAYLTTANMNPITRVELQSLESKYKRQKIENLLQPAYNMVRYSATSGETQVFIQTEEVSRPVSNGNRVQVHVEQRNDIIRTWDLQGCLEVLKEFFPDSKVELKETWVDASPTNRVLKKGFLIDWS